MEAIQQPLGVMPQGIIHGCEGEHGDSREDSRRDSLYAVGGHGSASAPLHECAIVFPTLSLTEPLDQHHRVGHVVTFPLGVRPQGCEYIAAKGKQGH